MQQDIHLKITPGQKLVLTITIESVTVENYETGSKPSLESILKKVSEVSNLDVQSIILKSKKMEFLLPRYAFCHIAHKVYGYSLKSVGKTINRHYTSVINACTELQNLRNQNISDAVILIKKLQTHYPVVL